MRAIFLKDYRLLDAAKSPAVQQDYESRHLIQAGEAHELVEIANPFFPQLPTAQHWWVLAGTTLGMSQNTWIEAKSIELITDSRRGRNG